MLTDSEDSIRIQVVRPPLVTGLHQCPLSNVSFFCNGGIKQLSVILNAPADNSSTVRSVINISTNEHRLSRRFRA